MDNRLYNNGNKKCFSKNFKSFKKNTICSLNEVELFLCNFKKFFKYIKIYKFLK